MFRTILALFGFSLLATSLSAADIDVGTGDTFPKDVKVGDVIKFERGVGGLTKMEVKVDGKELKGKNMTGQSAAIVKMKYEVKAAKAGTLEIEITNTPPNGTAITKKYKIEVKE